MQALLAALASLAAPITARILIALGFSVVTVAGVGLSWQTVLDSVLSNLGAMPAAAAQLIGLGGGWIALGAVFGACSFVVTLWGLTAATRVMGVGS